MQRRENLEARLGNYRQRPFPPAHHPSRPKIYIDLKIGVRAKLTVLEGHRLASEAKRTIMSRHPEVEDVLVHVNPAEGA